MKSRTKLLAAVQEYLGTRYTGPITIDRETDDEELTPPRAVVRVSSAEPIVPGEPVWNLTVLVAAFQDADRTTAVTAETQSGELFAAFDDENGDFDEAALVTFCAVKGVALSAAYVIDSEATTDETNWVHVLGLTMIAAEF